MLQSQKELFFIIPLLLSIGFTVLSPINKDILNGIMVVLAILIAMFFAMLTLTHIFFYEKKQDKYKKVAKETVNTILFEIVCSVSILIISLLGVIINSNNEMINIILRGTGSIIVYYLIFVVVLQIFVSLKRIKKMTDELFE
ncbi:MAG: hypothetical protein ACRDCC_04885 [Culicoidibacterales bacterium]